MSSENDDQRAFWERFAEVWVTNQANLDGMMIPVLEGVLSRADLQPGQKVLDIGCGTGTSVFEAAKRVGAEGFVTGADISGPMVARASERGAEFTNIEFVLADVAHHPFPPGAFDQVISRFGTMFFADPVVAFRNIRRAMKPGGRLTMACWSHLDKNPWFGVPMYAAKARLGAPPQLDPYAPGPLAFRDIDRVCGILDEAGFSDVGADEDPILLTPPGTLENVAHHASSIGPAARAFEYFEGTQEDFDAVTAAVAEKFSAYMTPEGVQVPAAINFFTAQRPHG